MTNDEFPEMTPGYQPTIEDSPPNVDSGAIPVNNNLSSSIPQQNLGRIIEPTNNQISSKLRNDRWKNRRKMAWLSLYAIIFSVSSLLFLGGFGIITIEAIVALTPIIQFFVGTLGGIIGAYIGFATIQFMNEDKFGVDK